MPYYVILDKIVTPLSLISAKELHECASLVEFAAKTDLTDAVCIALCEAGVRPNEIRVLRTYAPHACKHCGAPNYSCSYTNAENLLSTKTCIDCEFWLTRIEAYRKNKLLVINKIAYYDDGFKLNPKSYSFMGFGGRLWTIRKTDGTIIKTNDLWHSGSIPARFQAEMPDNAEFLPNE